MEKGVKSQLYRNFEFKQADYIVKKKRIKKGVKKGVKSPKKV